MLPFVCNNNTNTKLIPLNKYPPSIYIFYPAGFEKGEGFANPNEDRSSFFPNCKGHSLLFFHYRCGIPDTDLQGLCFRGFYDAL